MKLYIQQKIFSWNERFTVKDENGQDRYFIEGEMFSWGHKLHVYDTEHREVAYIQEKVFSLLPRYRVYLDGDQGLDGEEPAAEIVKQFTFFRPKYSIEGIGWEINGDFWDHEYEIMEGGRQVVSIRKEWFTWGDCYEILIENDKDERMALAVLLAIDCALCSEEASVTASIT